MRIQHNIMAMNAYRNYNNNTKALSKNLERLSSGYKINRAGDDAAGLAISEKMRAQITGLDAAQKNVKDGISLVNTAEGAMQEIHDMLNRMTYLATQSANGTYDNEVDRLNLQKEVESLKSEINRIADSANFNGIKLLDGVSGQGRLSELPVEYTTISTTAGVDFDTTAGTGTAGVYELDISALHGTGDTITFTGKTAKDPTGATTDLNNNAAGLTLTYNKTSGTSNTTFAGDTIEEQAKSIADALKLNADFAANFDIKAEGSKVILTANVEGTDGATIANVVTTDKTVDFQAVDSTTTPGTPNAATAGTSGWDGLFSTDGLNPEAGDELKFTFTDPGGKTLTATLTVTEAMLQDREVDKVTAAIAKALSNTNFDDVAETGVDESKLKVSDLFEVTANVKPDKLTANTPTANKGGLHFESKSGTQATSAVVTGATLKKPDGTEITGPAVASGTGKVVAAGTAGDAQVYSVATATNNFSAGDVFRMSGKLSSGEEFSVELTAGKDFDIGADYKTTLSNIASKLNSDEVTIKVGGKDVAANTVFGTTAGKSEFSFVANNGALTITSQRKGEAGTKGVAGIINNIEVSTAAEATSKFTATAPVAQGSAVANINLSEGVGAGTTIEVNGKNYEVVSDLRDVSNRSNVAVVVDDLANASVEDIANALKSAIEEEGVTLDKDGNPDYEVSVNGSTVTVKSTAKGSDTPAISVSTPYGDQVKVAKFKFDPKAVKAGSKLDFNGTTYEFVKKGEAATIDGAKAIEVEDFSKATSKSLADAFVNVLNNGTAEIADDGTITLKGMEVDGVISDPVVTFDNNLVLQIGDTADSFNQLTVKLSDMHTTAMGIDGINIGTQEGAQAAIDVIRDAINYVSGVRGDLGAISNRLDHTANNLSVMEENIQDAESTIRDTDIADEMMAYTKNNILVQSAQAMLAQANQVPQGVLQLLQ